MSHPEGNIFLVLWSSHCLVAVYTPAPGSIHFFFLEINFLLLVKKQIIQSLMLYLIFLSFFFKLGYSGKEPACQPKRLKRCRFHPQGQEDPLEEGMATHYSILAWRIPWTEEPGGLQSKELQRIGHNWSNLACNQASYTMDPIEKAKSKRIRQKN